MIAALERCEVRLASSGEAGRVAVLDLMRARTRRFEVVFVLGLEEGSLPRRSRTSPFLDDDRAARARRQARASRPGRRATAISSTPRARAPSRRLYLVREAATDEGTPREPSPFWEEVAAVFDRDDVAHATTRRPLSALRGRSRRRRPSASGCARSRCSQPPTPTQAVVLAEANGWGRRLARARCGAAPRDAACAARRCRAVYGAKTMFSVTELERFADCSSAWLFERVISPRTIDAEADAMLRGSVAHSALHKFYAGLPKELGSDRVVPENVEQAVGFLRRCLDDALRGGVRLELTELQAAELEESLWRDLEGFVRDEAASPLQLVPRQFEVAFGSDRSAPAAPARPASSATAST